MVMDHRHLAVASNHLGRLGRVSLSPPREPWVGLVVMVAQGALSAVAAAAFYNYNSGSDASA